MEDNAKMKSGRKPGRPPKEGEALASTLYIRLTPDVRDAVERLRIKNQHVTGSEAARAALVAGLKSLGVMD